MKREYEILYLQERIMNISQNIVIENSTRSAMILRYAYFQLVEPNFRNSNFSFIFAARIRPNALAAFGLWHFSADTSDILRISAHKREFDAIGTE